jgi:hypothetical protein
LGVKPEIIERFKGHGFVFDADKSVRETGKMLWVLADAPVHRFRIDGDEQAASLMEIVFAHHVPGAGQVVFRESPNLVPEFLVFGIIGGTGGCLNPEQKLFSFQKKDFFLVAHGCEKR